MDRSGVKRLAVFSSLLVVFIVLLPTAYMDIFHPENGVRKDLPAISVDNGNLNYNWTAKFVNATSITWPENMTAVSIIQEKGFRNSTLNLTIGSYKGSIVASEFLFPIWVSISGILAPNLLASGLDFNSSVNATKAALQNGIESGLNGPLQDRSNTSFNSTAAIPGYYTAGGSTSFTFPISLLNEANISSYSNSTFFHFSGWFPMSFQLSGWDNLTWHYSLSFSIAILGLSSPVHSTVHLLLSDFRA